MQAIHARFGTAVLGMLLVVAFSSSAQTPPHRAIAITIDDLPAGAADRMTGAEILAMTSKLLGTLREQKVPAVGFVNEKRLYKQGEVDERIKALSLWLENGFDLGNHTFEHTSLNRVPLQVWEEEVIRGETITQTLLAEHKMKLRYFRHPYLDTGRDLQTRREAEAFLSSRGYQVAPITIDGWDWMYATVYEDARKRGDTVVEQQLVTSYLEYTASVLDFYEKASKDLFAYEPKQIVLLHANWLEADHIGDLIEVLRKRGYEFITLENALSDAAYSTPDEYVGEGTGWIDHWANTRGKPLLGGPEFPQWVVEKAKELHGPSSSSTPY